MILPPQLWGWNEGEEPPFFTPPGVSSRWDHNRASDTIDWAWREAELFSPCAWPGSPPRSMAALSGAFSENEFRPAVKFQGLPLLPAPPIALSSPPIRWGSIPPRPHLQAALLSPQCSPLLPYLPSKPSLHTFLFPHQTPASQFPPTLFLLVPCTCWGEREPLAALPVTPHPPSPLLPPCSGHRLPVQKAGGRGCRRPAALTFPPLCPLLARLTCVFVLCFPGESGYLRCQVPCLIPHECCGKPRGAGATKAGEWSLGQPHLQRTPLPSRDPQDLHHLQCSAASIPTEAAWRWTPGEGTQDPAVQLLPSHLSRHQRCLVGGGTSWDTGVGRRGQLRLWEGDTVWRCIFGVCELSVSDLNAPGYRG